MWSERTTQDVDLKDYKQAFSLLGRNKGTGQMIAQLRTLYSGWNVFFLNTHNLPNGPQMIQIWDPRSSFSFPTGSSYPHCIHLSQEAGSPCALESCLAFSFQGQVGTALRNSHSVRLMYVLAGTPYCRHRRQQRCKRKIIQLASQLERAGDVEQPLN